MNTLRPSFGVEGELSFSLALCLVPDVLHLLIVHVFLHNHVDHISLMHAC